MVIYDKPSFKLEIDNQGRIFDPVLCDYISIGSVGDRKEIRYIKNCGGCWKGVRLTLKSFGLSRHPHRRCFVVKEGSDFKAEPINISSKREPQTKKYLQPEGLEDLIEKSEALVWQAKDLIQLK
ncbi:MAG TPA: hypothetical protein VNA68_03345 [Candidatus Dormibacteraeota bacterium]|nr:hypothetical protein [Candidatus Dormibacteraeota bacterium]